MSNIPKLGLCPDCKAVISRSASSCPKCGRPVSEGDLLDVPDHSASFQRGCLVIGLIIIFIVVLGMLLHQPFTEEGSV